MTRVSGGAEDDVEDVVDDVDSVVSVEMGMEVKATVDEASWGVVKWGVGGVMLAVMLVDCYVIGGVIT